MKKLEEQKDMMRIFCSGFTRFSVSIVFFFFLLINKDLSKRGMIVNTHQRQVIVFPSWIKYCQCVNTFLTITLGTNDSKVCMYSPCPGD